MRAGVSPPALSFLGRLVPTPNVTTLCAAKTFLQIPDSDTSRDAIIKSLIAPVSSIFKKVTGRVFGTYEYTEYYSRDGSPLLILRQRPVTPDGLRVFVDTQGYWGQGNANGEPFPADSELQAGEFALQLDGLDGVSESGFLERVQNVWPMATARLWQNQSPELADDHVLPSGNVKVIYSAGELPPEIQTAANYAIANILQSNQRAGMISSEGYEDYSYALAIPPTVAGIQGMIGAYAWSILAANREIWF